ncbi:hypothetical protein BLNAU_11083 [Blattamonas nauphoetae]|uniref:Uncharacterized protein n=1 Tax=Blattamonas nauphoetae TaxID=2049346 RepID=A0ABQ9XSR2_9EUKA|nr:hypothetical protein BLNAU_11083 [Blattamonas nauphoetae]
MTDLSRKLTSSTDSPSPDCSPFLNWDGETITSEDEQAVIFRSLVATLKLQPALDVSLETTAVRFLKSVLKWTQSSIDAFLTNSGLTIDESLTNFVQSIGMLVSSPSQAITTAAMEMFNKLNECCSVKLRIRLVKADLVPQLINTINAVSLSFEEAADIHIHLMSSIATSVRLASPDGLIEFRIEYGHGQQDLHKMILKQVVMPSEENKQDPANVSEPSGINSWFARTILNLACSSDDPSSDDSESSEDAIPEFIFGPDPCSVATHNLPLPSAFAKHNPNRIRGMDEIGFG